MATSTRALTAETLGAWLVKVNDSVSAVDELVRTGFSTVRTRCLRPTYRTDLLEPGQPVLLWLSGSSTVRPAGIYARGCTTGRATTREDDGKLVVPVELGPVDPPVLRRDLLLRPVLSRIEVLRMAAGSNPSFVTPDALAELRYGWPQLR